MNDYIVEMKKIRKTFGEVQAVKKGEFNLKKGEIHSLIGENGAGKSTMMKMLYGMYGIDDGEIIIGGEKVENLSPKIAIEKGIGMVHQEFMLVDELTVLENVILGFEPRKGLTIDFDSARKNIQKYIDHYGMDVQLNKKINQISVGEAQRVEIIKTLTRGANIIILDEPINGLDPLGISEIRETLLQLQQENITILISSHILSELYLVANKFGILEGGKIVKELSKEQLDNECSHCLLLKVNDIKKASVLLEEELKTANYKVLNDQEIRLYDYLDAQHIVSKAIVEKGIELYAISEIGVSLEEYFKNIIRDGE